MMDKHTLLDAVKGVMKNQHNCTLATVDESGQPQAAAIFCVMHEDDGVLFFPTRSGSRKYQNIQHNSAVALVITHPVEAITIQLHGIAEEVTDPADAQHAIDHLTAASATRTIKRHWLPVKRLQDLQGGRFTIIKIRPTWIRFSDFRDEEEKDNTFVNEVTL